MEDLGYGKDYKYPHDYPDHFVEEEYLPENLKGRTYYHPTEQGFEKEIKKRLEYLEKEENGKGPQGRVVPWEKIVWPQIPKDARQVLTDLSLCDVVNGLKEVRPCLE